MSVEADALLVRIRRESMPTRVTFASLRGLELWRGRSRAREGALIGLTVGAVFGAYVGAAVGCADSPPPCHVLGPAALLAALVGGEGVVVGALIGLPFTKKRWETVPLPRAQMLVRPGARGAGLELSVVVRRGG